MGKSLASGMPLSAVLGRREIMESLESPANVYTTAANPVSTAAALATLDVIENEHLMERSKELGEIAREFFEGEQKRHDFIGGVRMYGLHGGIDIVDPKTGLRDTDATNYILYALFKRGVLMISLQGSTLRFQPPLVITEEQLRQAFDVLHGVFNDYENGRLTAPTGRHHIGW